MGRFKMDRLSLSSGAQVVEYRGNQRVISKQSVSSSSKDAKEQS